MTSKSLEIRVGTAVVVASLIVIIGIMWLQRFKLTEKRYPVYVEFSEVGGLTKDDPVNINGVERGMVEKIYPRLNDIIVKMGLQETAKLPRDSKVTLRSIGIMGERFVSIRTGMSGEIVQPGDTLVGYIKAGMSEVMSEAGDVLKDLGGATENLNKILASMNERGRLETSMENMRAVSEGLKKMAVGDNAPLQIAVDRFENVAEMLDSLLSPKYAKLDSSLDAFAVAGTRINSTLDDLTKASNELRELTEKLNSGKGTLGQLVNDDALIQKLDSTVTNLDGLISDIKKHPGRYFSVRLF